MSKTWLRIELLGQLRALDAGAVPVRLPSARRRALLSYLILHRTAPVLRQRLASLLWPDSADAQARTNLRRELHHLRNELPHADGLLEVGAEALQWTGGERASVDVEEFDALLGRAARARAEDDVSEETRALSRAATVYRGDLLPSISEDWVEAERGRLRAALLTGLSRLVALHEASGNLDAAMACAERVVRLEPFDEGAYRALMRLHQSTGSRAAAIHAFHRLNGVLRREFDLGPSEPTRQAYQELLATDTEAFTPDMVGTPDEMPLVGRDGALADLVGAWAEACTRGPAVVLVHGEAGIGKTRLVEEFVRHVHPRAATVARARAYAAEGPASYGLALDWLRTPAVAVAAADLPSAWREELARLAPELAAVSRDVEDPPDGGRAPWRRRRLLEAIAQTLLAAPQPLLLVVDDLQWADADSLAALHVALRSDPSARVLVAVTARTEELPGNAHVEDLLTALRRDGRLRECELGRLGPEETALLAREASGERLSRDQLEHLFGLSEGVPLFVVEALRADGDETARPHEPHADVGAAVFSPRVRAVLAARLGQLSPAARHLAELAATVGRAFSFDVLREASGQDEEGLARALDELWRRRIVQEQGAGEYDFSHDALRGAAYRGTEPARRRLLHRRVAAALESLHLRASGIPSARAAHHYEQGADVERAVDAYLRAAGEAVAVFSHEEAVRLLDRAHALLVLLPATPDRDRKELELQIARAVPLRYLGGHAAPELYDAMRRAQELSEQLDDRDGLHLALSILQTTRLVRGRPGEAGAFAERLQLAARGVPDWRAVADHQKGGMLLTTGDLEGSIEAFERSLRHHDPEAGTSHVAQAGASLPVFTPAFEAHALWLYGRCDRALASAARAVALAQDLDHPYSLVVAHAYVAALHHMRRDRRASLRHATAARDLCQRYGFAYYVHWGRLFGAWAEPGLGHATRVATVRDAIASIDHEGAAVRKPFYMSVLAIVLARAGQCAAARATLDEAAELAEAHVERWWRPEITRLRALYEPDPATSLAGLQEALACALSMKARPLAARAAASLALALRARGRAQEARRMLDQTLDDVLGASPQSGSDRDHRRLQWLAARLSA